MKKIVVLASLLLMGLLLLNGCSKDSEDTVTDTGTTTTTTVTDAALADSVEALYDVTKVGAGAGTTSFGVRGRYYVGSTMGDLGAADDTTGEYTVTNTGVTGMVCKVKFLSGTDVVYFNQDAAFGANADALQLYSDQLLTASKITTADIPQDASAAALFPRYIPSMFCKLSDSKPVAWFTINTAGEMADLSTGIATFINDNFPTSMINTVSGAIPAGTISLILTSTMVDKPTDANPSTQAGTGTITTSAGEVLTIVSEVTIGATGPIGGTQTFTSTSGFSGALTFKADKTMDGTISKAGATVATIHINADGTGSYTNSATGVVTAI